MVNILHLISGGFYAGAEAMVFNLIDALSKNNELKLCVVLLNKKKLAKLISKLNVELYIIDENKYNLIQIIKEVKRVIKEQNPNIIHSHGYKENIVSYISTINNKMINKISTIHGLPEKSGKNLKWKIISKLNIAVLRYKYNLIIAVSESIKENLNSKYSIPFEKINVIFNGIKLPPAVKIKTNMNHFVVGNFSRLVPIKNIQLFILVACAIINKRENVLFKIAGEGPEKQKLIEIVKNNNVDKLVRLDGFIDDIDKYYRMIDVYICTSHHEGMPISILEAMSYGIPVIANNVGGIREIIRNDKQGLLISKNNFNQFVEKCLYLYDNPYVRKKNRRSSQEKN